MGSSSSAPGWEQCGGDLRLPTSRLHFTSDQLRAVNCHFGALAEASDKNEMSSDLESTVEGLVQRLVDGAGQKDPRFRCQHLVALHREKRLKSPALEYLVPLDALPPLGTDADCRLLEGPAGYGRLQLSGRLARQWRELLTPAGYLWRAAVVERWVALVCAGATDARRRLPRACAAAGRVLGARAAATAAPHEYCYLETTSGGGGGGDGDEEYRLAIVEGALWVSVRVRGAGGAEAEARLALAVRGAGGTARAAHAARVTLAHPLALLHYTAAATGFYATAVGPPTSLACPERQAAWQLWHPALESELDAQHCARGGAGRAAAVLNAVVDELRAGRVEPGLRVVSRYAVSCSLRRRLERCCDVPTGVARAVPTAHVAYHVLSVLDSLVAQCAARRCEGYVYDTPCLARGGARSGEADWRSDAVCLANYLTFLHHTVSEPEIPVSPAESLEMSLLRRWEAAVREAAVRETRGGTPVRYSRAQAHYVARLCRELVRYKESIAQEKHSTFRANLLSATSQQQEPIEELVHILAIMLDQARDVYLANFKQNKLTIQPHDPQQENISYRSKKMNKLREYYDISSACLIDAVRRDPDIRNEDLTDDVNKIKNVMTWLHKGIKDDKKYLRPVLKPFLDALYRSSHENCWFLEDFDARKLKKEYQGLRVYCLGVHAGSVDPSMGLLDSAKKYAWAKAMVDFIDRWKHSGVKLVFPAGGDVVTCAVRLPSRREDERSRCLTLTRQDKQDAKRTLATRCVLHAFAAAVTADPAPPPPPPPPTKSPSSEDYPTTSSERSEEFLSSAQLGKYWRNTTKPDLVTSNALNLGSTSSLASKPVPRPRRSQIPRPATTYGYPDIPINIAPGDAMTMRKKYHTLKSLVYSDSVDSIRGLRERPRSAGNTLKLKQPMSRPSILETLDFINGVRDALRVEESGASDVEEGSGGGGEEGRLLREVSPLNLLARLSRADNPHHTLGNVVAALIAMGKFTALQELAGGLGEGRAGALLALHRLARAARSRSHSTERSSRLAVEPVPPERTPPPPQRYRPRPPDYFSEDDAPPPPAPPPRPAPQTHTPRPHYPDYSPPKRHQNYDDGINKALSELSIGRVDSCHSSSPQPPLRPGYRDTYTGIINPIYDEKRTDKFSKRSKSLGRSFSGRKAVLEATRYNITLGRRTGRQTNDVVTALMGTSERTGLDYKGVYLQRYSSGVVGDSYKVSRVTID